MATCIKYNCADLPDYESTIQYCGSKVRLSGASFIGLVECGSSITNPSSAAQLNALIAAEDMKIVANVKAGFGDPSAVTQDPITACGTQITTNYTRSVTLFDYKVTSTNTAFWNAAARRSFSQLVIWECETDGLSPLVSFVDSEITVTAKRIFPNSNDQAQYYDVTLSWKALSDPDQYDAPVGVTGVDA